MSQRIVIEGQMILDPRVCSRARLSRDPRFDGKFFIAVRGSGVYCRPICPSPTAKEKNVRYFPTAAAAAEAGFRPCLRCRPECSPGTPAWIGTPNTVSRALRLISENGLNGGVESLARHLGVGSRHLRRLFIRHLGATPIAVAQTRRLHFAKNLIDETKLSMHEIAVASGFGCVRRFNEAIRKTYKRTPTQIRRLSRQTDTLPENHYLFRLRYRPPFDWENILNFLKSRVTPGIEQVKNGVYSRSISFRDAAGYFEASHDRSAHSLSVRVRFGDPKSLFSIIERIRVMFDLNADWTVIAKVLRADPFLAPHIKADPGLRVPGCWDGFEVAIKAILGERLTASAATQLAARLVSRFGRPLSAANGLTHLFPEPASLAQADVASIGLSQAQTQTIQAFSRSVLNAEVNFAQFKFDAMVDFDAFVSRLCQIPGFEKTAAQYVAIRTLGNPDAFPSTDRGLFRTIGLRNPVSFEQRADAWRPWRAYAAMYLWTVSREHAIRSKQPHPSKGKKSIHIDLAPPTRQPQRDEAFEQQLH